MSADSTIFERAAVLERSGAAFVLVTVIRTQGSTPRDPGAAMIWTPDAPTFGTVGGGVFELLVSGSAQQHVSNQSSGTEELVLGRDADQCCGGKMEVFFQYVGPKHRLVIFGAGHVAQELAAILDNAPLELIVVDDRNEWLTRDRFPRCRLVDDFDQGIARSLEARDSTLVCIMTCSHDRDFALLRALLPEPPAFVGLIGSKSKRVSFFSRLAASGIDETAIHKVQCPIGLGDMGKQPRLVAISIAGQVLLEIKKLEGG